MGSKKWRIWHLDDNDYPEESVGHASVGQAIVHVILALLVLFAVYTFFATTEWDPASGSDPKSSPP